MEKSKGAVSLESLFTFELPLAALPMHLLSIKLLLIHSTPPCFGPVTLHDTSVNKWVVLIRLTSWHYPTLPSICTGRQLSGRPWAAPCANPTHTQLILAAASGTDGIELHAATTHPHQRAIYIRKGLTVTIFDGQQHGLKRGLLIIHWFLVVRHVESFLLPA